MKIECIVDITVSATVRKAFKYKRKGYFIGTKWVKPKTITRYREVSIKKPSLIGDIRIIVDELLIINGCYSDEYRNKYICTNRQVFGENNVSSELRISSMQLGQKFKTPTQLVLIGNSVGA